MSMAHHVYRHAVDKNRKVSAVIGIETAKQNLVRFAATVMLADSQAGSQAHDVARRIRWP